MMMIADWDMDEMGMGDMEMEIGKKRRRKKNR